MDARHFLFPLFRFINYQLQCIDCVHVRACVHETTTFFIDVAFLLLLLVFFMQICHITSRKVFFRWKNEEPQKWKRQVRKVKERYHTRLLLLLRSLIKYCWYCCCWIWLFVSRSLFSIHPRHHTLVRNRSCSLRFECVCVCVCTWGCNHMLLMIMIASAYEKKRMNKMRIFVMCFTAIFFKCSRIVLLCNVKVESIFIKCILQRASPRISIQSIFEWILCNVYSTKAPPLDSPCPTKRQHKIKHCQKIPFQNI